ncbi:hypothetical protein MMC13_003157 [Lambiella insularis]|nr:hypothetical protein [Lambiella insularis]
MGKNHHPDQEKAAYTPLIQGTGVDAVSIEQSATDFDLQDLEKQPATRRHITTIAVKMMLLVLALWGLTNLCWLAISALQPTAKAPSCSCGGTTVAEAISRGCVFTPLAISWLPPHCLDMEVADEFDKAGPGPDGVWEYYADPERKTSLNRTELGLLPDHDGIFYTTQDWHITHCTFNWRKRDRQQLTGVTLERRSSGLDHVAHCEKIFKMRGELTDIRTAAGVSLDADDLGETSL